MQGESSLDFANNSTSDNSTPEPSCLNILYYNARSIIPKMDELRALVDLQQPHIVSIVESWLSGEISDNEIHLQG